MDLSKKYFERLNDTIENKGAWVKEKLLQEDADVLTFDSVINFILFAGVNEEISSEYSDPNFLKLAYLFKNNLGRYKNGKGKKELINGELQNAFIKSKLSEHLTYEQFIIKLATYNGLEESLRIIQNSSSFFKVIYNEKIIESEFYFIGDSSKIEEIRYDLVEKLNLNNVYLNESTSPEYPLFSDKELNIKENQSVRNKTSKKNKQAIIEGQKLSRKEYSFFLHMIYNANEMNIDNKYKWIYEYGQKKYDDPFNYGDIHYKKSHLYSLIKVDKMEEGTSFKYDTFFEKAHKMVDNMKDIKLIKYIEDQKTLFYRESNSGNISMTLHN